MAAVRRVCGEGDRYFLSRYQVASGLRLQMLLYFNVYVAVMYAVLHPLIFQWKATTWPPRIIVAVCQPMFYYVWLVMEPIRLIVGHVGNLGERVAWLAPFWILTLFPQALTQVYFLLSTFITGWVTLPIEYVRQHGRSAVSVPPQRPPPPPPKPGPALLAPDALTSCLVQPPGVARHAAAAVRRTALRGLQV